MPYNLRQLGFNKIPQNNYNDSSRYHSLHSCEVLQRQTHLFQDPLRRYGHIRVCLFLIPIINKTRLLKTSKKHENCLRFPHARTEWLYSITFTFLGIGFRLWISFWICYNAQSYIYIMRNPITTIKGKCYLDCGFDGVTPSSSAHHHWASMTYNTAIFYPHSAKHINRKTEIYRWILHIYYL